MDRVPCKICGALVLPETFSRNDGLCGRCARGHRPCIYCGKLITYPNGIGEFSHLECVLAAKRKKASRGWKTLADIEWDVVAQIIDERFSHFFQIFAPARRGGPNVNLAVYLHVEDHVDIYVNELTDQDQVIGIFEQDPTWLAGFSAMSSSFETLFEELADTDGDAHSIIESTLLSLLTQECEKLQTRNFYFPNEIQVNWSVSN